MVKQISSTFTVIMGTKPTMADRKEEEHRKKVKDPERALKRRRAMFPGDFSGNSIPVDKPDPKHIIKRGKTIGGQQNIDVDKQDLVKALAKDPYSVQKSIEVIRGKNEKI